jgi:WS/DGAT/MGAT family acyltransferase
MAHGDAAWLHMDRPTNLMVVNSVMWFDEPLDWDDVRALVHRRLLARFPRFSQRVVQARGSVWWEDVANFDPEPHLHHVTLKQPGDRATLERYVSSLLADPLPLDRPLWDLYLVDGYHGDGGTTGSALLSRIHHCVADGIALMRVMLSLTDDPVEAAGAQLGPAGAAESDALLPAAIRLSESLAGELVHPAQVVDAVAATVTGTLASAKAFVKLVGLPPDRRTALRGTASRRKRLVWSDPIDLSALKRTAHAAGVTVNDLLLTAVSGALRAHLARTDGHAPDVRAIVPYNIRPLDQPLPPELGNKFGLVFLSLPVSVDDAVERLLEQRRRMNAIKHSAEGVVSFRVLDLVGYTPYTVEQVIVDLFAAKGTAVMTNVAGPRQPVFLAGREVRGTIGWPPESGNLGLGVSIISYNGNVTLGLMSDAGLVPDPGALLDAARRELDTLNARFCGP